MSIQWTFIAGVLYTEIFLVVLMLLPFISPTRWQQIFRSRLLRALQSHANLYFNIFFGLLGILFVDAVRDMWRYSATHDSEEILVNPQADVTLHMKLFRSQRNFYIAGFTMFLFLVLRRLTVLISAQARLQAECEASLKQASSASEAARRVMETQSDNEKNEAKLQNDETEELTKTKLEVAKLQTELRSALSNLDVMKKQADAGTVEYDRLLKEHRTLQEKLLAFEGKVTDKKSD